MAEAMDIYDLENMDPFRKGTELVPDKWEGKHARVKLMTVPWDKDWNDIIDWQSNEQRDHYFEELEGHTEEMLTGWNFRNLEVWKPGLGKHAGDLLFPLPYASAIDFNYAFIELYETPVPGGKAERRETYLYFIVGLTSQSASVTKLALELDSVNTYWPSIKVQGLNLQRGHYFHAQTPADKFLADPLENALGITAPEPDLESLKTRVSHTQLVSFAKSQPRVCVATTGDFTDRRSWFTAVPRDTEDDPDARVVGYPTATTPGSQDTPYNQPFDREWGDFNSFDSLGKKASVKQMDAGAGSLEGLNVYSMSPQAFENWVAYARQSMSQILSSIKAVYVLDSAIIDEGEEFSQWGYSFKPVRQTSDPKFIESFAPTKEMFDYPDYAQEWAKLYTAQFAKIEVSNIQGARAEISIEEIAQTLDIYARSSSLFPYLKLEALIDGVGGSGVKSYSVRPLSAVEAKSFGGRWEDFRFDLNVPLYGITIANDQLVSQEKEYERRQAARAAAANRELKLDLASMTWGKERNAIGMEWDNALAEVYLRRDNGYLRARTEQLNATDENRNRSRVGNTETQLAYSNEGIRISLEYANANRENSNTLTTGGRSISTAYDNAYQSAEATNTISKDSARTAQIKAENEAYLGYNLWFDKIRDKTYQVNVLDRKQDINYRWSNVWFAKQFLFNTTLKAAVATAGMSVLTSAKVAAISGSASIWGGVSATTGGSGVEGVDSQGETTVSGTGGHIGMNLIDVINRAIMLDANAAIWEFQVNQINIINAKEAYAYMEERGTVFEYEGPGIKHVEYNVNNKISELNRDFDLQAIDREWALESYSRDETEQANVTVAMANITAQYALDLSNADIGFSTAKDIAERTMGTDSSNLNSDYGTKATNISETSNAGRSIQQSEYDTGLQIVAWEYNTRETVIERNYSTARTIVAAEEYTAVTNIGRTYSGSRIPSINTELEMKQLEAAVEYGLARSEWTSKYLTDIQGEPVTFGEVSGDAATDIWGLRGLEIRVIRCTDSTAAQAASIFAQYGYWTNGIFIREPELSVMTGFTYWQADNVWLTGDLINESNKQLIRDTFARGVTIWKDPTLIFNYDIMANRPLEEEA